MSIARFNTERLNLLGKYIERDGKLFPLDPDVHKMFSDAIDAAIAHSKKQIPAPRRRGFLHLVHSRRSP
jgi:hypothetical protein